MQITLQAGDEARLKCVLPLIHGKHAQKMASLPFMAKLAFTIQTLAFNRGQENESAVSGNYVDQVETKNWIGNAEDERWTKMIKQQKA